MNASMDATLTIDRPTNASGVWGQNTESFTNIATGVPCLIHDVTELMQVPLGGGFASGAGMVGSIEGFEVWFANGTPVADRKSTRLNSSHANISYAVFCLKKKKQPSIVLY